MMMKKVYLPIPIKMGVVQEDESRFALQNKEIFPTLTIGTKNLPRSRSTSQREAKRRQFIRNPKGLPLCSEFFSSNDVKY
jgi:hypothetical protein